MDLNDRRPQAVDEEAPGERGLRPSPDGRTALYWGTDGNYWTLDLVTGDEKNLTKGVATSFVNTEDDHNNLYPVAEQVEGMGQGWQIGCAIGRVGHVEGAHRWQRLTVNLHGQREEGSDPVPTALCVRQRSPRGRPRGRWRAVTDGAGGRGGGGEGIDLSKPLYVATYGEWTKKEGLSRVDPDKPGATTLFSEPAKFAVQKARDADVFLYTKQTFVDFPNYYVANPDWKGGRQITDINPQQKDYAWSAGTRLIDYKSDKGAKLQGALYLPANYDPTKKYPLLVTIYEKRSNLLNGYITPSETRAPDPTLYTSRGYAVTGSGHRLSGQ